MRNHEFMGEVSLLAVGAERGTCRGGGGCIGVTLVAPPGSCAAARGGAVNGAVRIDCAGGDTG